MWKLYEIQSLASINKGYWIVSTFIIYVLSVAIFPLKRESWVAVTETAEGILNISHFRLVSYKSVTEMMTRQQLLCHVNLRTTHFIIFLGYQFIPTVSKQEKCTLNGVLLRHIGVWIILSDYSHLWHCNCLKKKKSTTYVDITRLNIHHNIPNSWERNRRIRIKTFKMAYLITAEFSSQK